jgi:hypothetical protein
MSACYPPPPKIRDGQKNPIAVPGCHHCGSRLRCGRSSRPSASQGIELLQVAWRRPSRAEWHTAMAWRWWLRHRRPKSSGPLTALVRAIGRDRALTSIPGTATTAVNGHPLRLLSRCGVALKTTQPFSIFLKNDQGIAAVVAQTYNTYFALTRVRCRTAAKGRLTRMARG